ncbi:hypothetical protein, partial [Pseudomonas sp.]|uniref:hypothetical protein n=1 Tax=Pseudomonas sp. TaxID=306 RepID=UPI002730D472
SVSNRCQLPLLPPPIISTEAPTGPNYHPVSPAHSTQLSLLCKPLFKSNFLFYKKFQEPHTPEELRIIGTAGRRSIDCYAFVSIPVKSRAAAKPATYAPPAETTKPRPFGLGFVDLTIYGRDGVIRTLDP